MIKKIVIIVKNKAVPTYAIKLVSGSGKKSRVVTPTIAIIGIR